MENPETERVLHAHSQNTSGVNTEHEAIEVIRLKSMKGLGLFPESKRKLKRSFMTREKSSPENMSIVADWEERGRKRERERRR